jgi:hypothetical protein
MSRTRAASGVLGVILVIWMGVPEPVLGATVYSYEARPGLSGGRTASSEVHARVAPSGPPLTVGSTEGESGSSLGASASAGDDDTDPLVANGLSSPLCKGPMSVVLSSAARSNCQTSAFVAAPAPTGGYGIDVNIDAGPFGVGYGALLSIVQELFVSPIWSALLWAVHALLVMIEWCYTLDLLDSSAMGAIASHLREAQVSFTEPWLALVLLVASVLALYTGIVRRRVAETLGHAVLTIAMMAVGLWVIADPIGTVGVVGRWADRASLGTLAAVASGTSANAPGTLAENMRAVFASAIQAPWCFLEFGEVDWCNDPARFEPRLRAAAKRIRAAQRATLDCRTSTTASASTCPPSARAMALALERSDRLISEASTNGELFLAFASGGSARNSYTRGDSLLHIMCQSEGATTCTGPAAVEATFRSSRGTFPRMIGVVAIAAGLLGMVMLLGFVAVRLLGAAIASLLMLLLAPAAVLAPALGDGGRAAFAGWATRLLGALTSKLLYSFLLGVLLVMQRTLTSLQPFGWWTQWMLLSAFWWGAFLKRHRVLAFVHTRGRRQVSGGLEVRPRRRGRTFEAPVVALNAARWAKDRTRSPAGSSERLRRRALPVEKNTRRHIDRRPAAGTSDPGGVGATPREGSGEARTPSDAGGDVQALQDRERSSPEISVSKPSQELQSRVLEDAREVAEGGKRYLGYGPTL